MPATNRASTAACSRIPVGGGTPAALDSTQFYGRGLTVDTSTVYFTTTRGLSKVSKLGGGAVVLAALQNGGPILAVDSASVFLTVINASTSGGCDGNAGVLDKSR